jgi:hypothetical protein
MISMDREGPAHTQNSVTLETIIKQMATGSQQTIPAT